MFHFVPTEEWQSMMRFNENFLIFKDISIFLPKKNGTGPIQYGKQHHTVTGGYFEVLTYVLYTYIIFFLAFLYSQDDGPHRQSDIDDSGTSADGCWTAGQNS